MIVDAERQREKERELRFLFPLPLIYFNKQRPKTCYLARYPPTSKNLFHVLVKQEYFFRVITLNISQHFSFLEQKGKGGRGGGKGVLIGPQCPYCLNRVGFGQ